MIDFADNMDFKLRPIKSDAVDGLISQLLIEGEESVVVCKAVRDFVVFTDRRIIAVDRQGFTGDRTDFTSLPYNKMQCFSVLSSGTFDNDGLLEVYMSATGKIRFEFSGNVNVAHISCLIAARAT